MQISNERWSEANLGEQEAWEDLFKDENKLEQFDALQRHGPILDIIDSSFKNKKICDIGGGPISLLRNFNIGPSVVVDPLNLPDKYLDFYASKNITYFKGMAEDFIKEIDLKFDEVWIYNCLQHVSDPYYILDNVYKLAPILRISEPCEVPTNKLHPHIFHVEEFKSYLNKISHKQNHKQITYDYPYVGGVFYLNNV